MKFKTLGIAYADAVNLFPACLDGYAAEKYFTLTIPKIEKDGSNAKVVWNSLIDMMAQAMAKPYQNEVAQEQLSARRRRENEDLDVYMKDIQRLVSLAYSAARKYTDEQRKAETIRYFVRGLNMPLKIHMKRLKTTDPETLIQEAHLEEEMQKQLVRERMDDAIPVNLINNMAIINEESQQSFYNFNNDQGYNDPDTTNFDNTGEYLISANDEDYNNYYLDSDQFCPPFYQINTGGKLMYIEITTYVKL
uniref:Uncharacterized protein n=1 Tax=Panagrolaimus sp. ES5 TaxID=591445 RepID=A0AC34G4A0_9BILA